MTAKGPKYVARKPRMTADDAATTMEGIRIRANLDWDSAKDDADELVAEILARDGYSRTAAAYDRIRSLKP